MNVFGPLTKKHDGMQILLHLRHVMKQTISYCTLGPIRNRRYFAFSWMKMYGLWLNFHWSLFPNVQLTISQHWFRLWSGADQETLSEPILVRLPTHICATGLNELMNITHSAWLYVTCDLKGVLFLSLLGLKINCCADITYLRMFQYIIADMLQQWFWRSQRLQCTPDNCILGKYNNILNNPITHWGRVTHMCVGKLTIIGSDIDLSPSWGQAIIWTNAEILLIGTLGNFSEILIEIHTFSM